MWQQVNAEAVAVSWEAALDYCETLVRAGRGDWRLPNTKELQSIVDYETKDPAINTAFFPNTKPDATAGSIYWTSTTQTMNSNYAWTVHFYHGGIFRENKTEQHYVRCLRGGQ
jgi:formylglycine-generating enzyme required for sulfatase activity